MNLNLLRSVHGIIAALVVAFLFAWMLMGGFVPGARTREGLQRDFLLATGWTAFALYAIVFAYVMRKYVHKLGISPEFRVKVPIAALERAERGIAALRRQVLAGTLTDRGAIRAKAREALRAEGVHRVRRLELRRGKAKGEPAFLLDLVPTFPLGLMFRWLHTHLYYGVAAAFVVYMHGGMKPVSLLGWLLLLLSAIVIGTGLVGIVLWMFGPTWLSSREKDLNIEKAFALNESLSAKVRAGYELLDPQVLPIVRDVDKARGDFHERARAALETLAARPEGSAKYLDFIALLGQQHEVRRELSVLWRRKLAIHLWRVVHIPCAVLLLFCVLLHVFVVFWY